MVLSEFSGKLLPQESLLFKHSSTFS